MGGLLWKQLAPVCLIHRNGNEAISPTGIRSDFTVSVGYPHGSSTFPVRLHRQNEFFCSHIFSVGSSRPLLRRVRGPNFLVPLSAVPPASAPGYYARLVHGGLSLGTDKSFGQKREPGLHTGALPAHSLTRVVRIQGGLPMCPYGSTSRAGACLDATQA